MLVECRYQTLDRDSLTFVSTHLPTMVNDDKPRNSFTPSLGYPMTQMIPLEAPLFLQGITDSRGLHALTSYDGKMGTRIPIFSINDSSRLLPALSSPGPSTINEMCLVFLSTIPETTLSSCQGHPDIIYVAHELGEEVSE